MWAGICSGFIDISVHSVMRGLSVVAACTERERASERARKGGREGGRGRGRKGRGREGGRERSIQQSFW